MKKLTCGVTSAVSSQLALMKMHYTVSLPVERGRLT